MTQTRTNAISGKMPLKTRRETRWLGAFFMLRLAEVKNLMLFTPPPLCVEAFFVKNPLSKPKTHEFYPQNSLITIGKGASCAQEYTICEFWCKPKACIQNSVSSPKGLRCKQGFALRHKYEFVAANSFTALNKYEFGAANSLPALNKYEFGATNSLPALNKYEFGATDSVTALNKYKFGAANSFTALDKYEFGATNSVAALRAAYRVLTCSHRSHFCFAKTVKTRSQQPKNTNAMGRKALSASFASQNSVSRALPCDLSLSKSLETTAAHAVAQKHIKGAYL